MKKKTSPKKMPSGPSRTISSKKKKSGVKSKGKSSKRSFPLRRPIIAGKSQKTRKAATKLTTNTIARGAKTRKKAGVISQTRDRSPVKYRIVRIMGQGQFTVDNSTLKRLSEIDDLIVQLVSKERSDDTEFRSRLTELTNIVETRGKRLDPKEIIQSDIILPSTDLSVDEAKKLFRGEGVVPEIGV